MTKLSIIIPVYNEERTIANILDKVHAVTLINNIEKEIILVNDASTDGTQERAQQYIQANPDYVIQYFANESNSGKGASIQKGIAKATGDYIVIQDADLEYDPNEYNLLLKPMEDGFADVVYGSRFKGHLPHRVLFFWHSIGNGFLTTLSNMATNLNMTDMETCYKAFKADILKQLRLREKRFGFEPEVTNKMAKVPGIRIYEVGISYYGRTYAEGKKINWQDGLRAIYCIVKYGFFAK